MLLVLDTSLKELRFMPLNEGNNWEWIDDAMYDNAPDIHAVSGNGSISVSVASNDFNLTRFRCWIPMITSANIGIGMARPSIVETICLGECL